MLLGCGFDLISSRVKGGRPAPRNAEEYFYQTRGRQLTRIAAQGFQEKLNGTKWADIPLPHNTNGADPGLFSTLKGLATRIVSKKEVNTYKGIWRHPAKGTGEICDKLAEEVLKAGALIHYKAQVTQMICVSDGGRETGDGTRRIDTVIARIGPDTISFKPSNVISSIPPGLLKRFLAGNSSEPPSNVGPSSSVGNAAKRTVVLVYLFPKRGATVSACLVTVTCPSTRIGRITNYAAFSPDMVPKGKTGLCCEIYCFGPDELLELDDHIHCKTDADDCGRSKLLGSGEMF
jgi:protoporphyrinogen oxidase